MSDKLKIKWDLFKNSKEARIGKTIEDFQEWLEARDLHPEYKDRRMFKFHLKAIAEDEIEPSIECHNCYGSGMVEVYNTDNLEGSCYNIVENDWCPLCGGDGKISKQTKQGLLF